MRKRFLILLCALSMACTYVCAITIPDTISAIDTIDNDSIAKKKKFTLNNVLKWPVLGLIYPGLSPETGISIGIGIQGVWNMPMAKTPSSLRVMGCYTQYQQWRIQATGSFYFEGKVPWLLQFTMQYRDYPDKYYGIGNQPSIEPINYGSNRFNTTIEPLFELPKHWSIGPMVDLLWEKVNTDVTIYNGNYNTLMWGPGISTQYDTRQGVYYPTKGMYFKFKGFYCDPYLGSDCRLWKLDADFRHFITLWTPKHFENDFQRVNGSLIFAYQVRLQAALTNGNNSDIPFQLLPTLGGDEILRGIRTNMFRNNTLWAVQTELRYPIYRILHGVAFASIGDVYNTQNWHWATPKIGYGLGLRVTVNRAHVNVRFDVARNNIYKSWNDIDTYSFYITASEAF